MSNISIESTNASNLSEPSSDSSIGTPHVPEGGNREAREIDGRENAVAENQNHELLDAAPCIETEPRSDNHAVAEPVRYEERKKAMTGTHEAYEKLSDFLNCAFSFVALNVGVFEDLDPACLSLFERAAWIRDRIESREIFAIDRTILITFLNDAAEMESRCAKAAWLGKSYDKDLEYLSISLIWASTEFIECMMENLPGLQRYYLENSCESEWAKTSVSNLFEQLAFSEEVYGYLAGDPVPEE